MIKPIKFLSGFVSNALTQAVRCLWNLVACLASMAFSLLCVFMAALQFAGGGRNQSKKTLLLMASAFKSSLKCGLVGVLQGIGVVTCASPLMRAAQACSEGISPKGILIPCGSNRNLAQRILGLNSWEEQKVEKKAPAKPEIRLIHPPSTKKTLAATEKPANETPTAGAKPKPPKEKPKQPINFKKNKLTNQEDKTSAWESLVKEYLKANTIKEMDRIRNKMALEHTGNYLNALKAASRPKSRSNAA